MATESILIIPDFVNKGKSLREKLLSMSFTNRGLNTTTTGSMSGPIDSNPNEVFLTLILNKESGGLYVKATDGSNIPYMKVEVNDVTPTTLKTAVLFEFRDVHVTSFQISGSHSGEKDPVITVAFRYTAMKHSFFK